jgi:hypothetical protein
MRFVTVPDTDTPTVDGASVATLDLHETTDTFDAVAKDRFGDRSAAALRRHRRPPPGG